MLLHKYTLAPATYELYQESSKQGGEFSIDVFVDSNYLDMTMLKIVAKAGKLGMMPLD
jgi:hypothetical protein